MPRQKDLKRLVRTRMEKTGEAYTTARAEITRKQKSTTQPKAQPAPVDYAALAGMSDATIKEKTGCTWERWVYALDRRGAAEMAHRDIADIVHSNYKIDGWWAQTVTVGYERIKGLRARGQRRDGSYEAGKSRTYNVPVTKLFNAWADAKLRRRWLHETGVKLRTAASPKTVRLGWSDGTIVVAGFTAKGTTKSSVAVVHTKLPDEETKGRLKQFWSDRLDALGVLFSD
jgi:hypothetical protein